MDYEKEIARLQKKAALLRKKKALAIKQENEQIGCYARVIFAEKLPTEIIEIKSFFEMLSKKIDDTYNYNNSDL